MGTLYAANKYLVLSLVKRCLQYLEVQLNPQNACLLLNHGRLFSANNLVKKCLSVIAKHPEEALSCKAFEDVDHATLQMIIQREELVYVDELVVLKAAVRWAKAECVRQSLLPTPANSRRVLGHVLYDIRIPTITPKQFVEGPAKSGILTSQETTDLFQYFSSMVKPDIPFTTQQRSLSSYVRPFVCKRYENVTAGHYNDSRFCRPLLIQCHKICFSVNKPVNIIGLGIYGATNEDSIYKMKMKLETEVSTLFGTKSLTLANDIFYNCSYDMNEADSDKTFKQTFLNYPISIPSDKPFIVSLTVKGPNCYFGNGGQAEVRAGPVLFTFQNVNKKGNLTDIESGQIPYIYFIPQ